MSPRSRAKRTLRWTALAVLVLSASWAAYRSAERLAEVGPEYAANRLLLNTLTVAILVLALGFVGVLIRNLVRLIADRKRGILGARLRTKLVFFFLALVLLPALLLSYGAAAFIKGTVDTLLTTPVQELVSASRDLVDEAGKREEARLTRAAERLSHELAAAGGRTDASRRAEAYLAREGEDVASVILASGAGGDAVGGALRRDPAAAAEATRLAREAAALALSQGKTIFRVEPVGTSFLVHAAVPWHAYDGTGKPRVVGVAAVGEIVPHEEAARMDKIAAAELAFHDFRGTRREVLRLYYSLIALIGLATVFVASWIGFSLARRITVPIQQVAAASREIAGGNLGVRVAAEAGDEVGMLVEAFNEMAAQLQESREVISKSTADLRSSNRALEERRRYVETLLASLSSGVLSLDGEGRITTANPAAASILGVSLEPGGRLREALDGKGTAPLIDAIDEVLAEAVPTATRRELVLQRAGAPVAVSIHVAPLRGTRGEDLGTLVLVEDLTDLLRAQKALAWQEVARRVAHEIKNPLTPIQLSAQRLRRKFAEGAADLSAVVESSTSSIEHEVGALKRLVDEFSRYARMPEPRPEPVDVAALIASVLALYEGHRAVAFRAEVDPALGRAWVDPEQIRRVLINLLDNAVAATTGEGRVRVGATPGEEPGSLRLEVEDDGPGLPEPLRARLFEPYFSTKRRGTGLGLAIVHRIVTEHRGTIRVEDGALGGLRFVIDVPGAGIERGAGTGA